MIATAGLTVEPARVISETVSGSVVASEQKGFTKLLHNLEGGDELVVTKLDRLGRHAIDLRATVEALTGMCVRVHCLALGGVDRAGASGKMTMGVIAAVPEFERDLLPKRTQSGLARARDEGKTLGRPSKLLVSPGAEVGQRRTRGEAIVATALSMGTSR